MRNSALGFITTPDLRKSVTKRHFSLGELEDFLCNKRNISANLTYEYHDHLDNCLKCWNLWNKVRWDASKGSRGVRELKEYLGEDFKEYFDSSWAIAAEWFKQEPKTNEEIADFYKANRSYLYNLVIWYESGDRDRFENDFELLREKFNVTSVIDYGSGVGNDGLLLLKKGFEVVFADYQCPSIDFLRWRLLKRGLRASILDVEKLDTLPDVDMFWAIDVLEHMTNPLWTVDHLSAKTRIFVHRSEFGNDAGGRHPCHFNFNELSLADALRKRGFRHIPWPVLSVWVKET